MLNGTPNNHKNMPPNISVPPSTLDLLPSTTSQGQRAVLACAEIASARNMPAKIVVQCIRNSPMSRPSL